jgi:hypothetical protein
MHREFVGALADRGLTVIDMKRTLDAHGNPLSSHFKKDGHWNKKGHILAAEALGAAFME